jgi:hypothetical protein
MRVDEIVVISVCRPCRDQCERGTRGYSEPNPECDAPGLCACLCRQSNEGRR